MQTECADDSASPFLGCVWGGGGILHRVRTIITMFIIIVMIINVVIMFLVIILVLMYTVNIVILSISITCLAVTAIMLMLVLMHVLMMIRRVIAIATVVFRIRAHFRILILNRYMTSTGPMIVCIIVLDPSFSLIVRIVLIILVIGSSPHLRLSRRLNISFSLSLGLSLSLMCGLVVV